MIASISLTLREGAPDAFLQVVIAALSDAGVSLTSKVEPAQNFNFQCPRHAAIVGTIGTKASKSSSAVQV